MPASIEWISTRAARPGWDEDVLAHNTLRRGNDKEYEVVRGFAVITWPGTFTHWARIVPPGSAVPSGVGALAGDTVSPSPTDGGA